MIYYDSDPCFIVCWILLWVTNKINKKFATGFCWAKSCRACWVNVFLPEIFCPTNSFSSQVLGAATTETVGGSGLWRTGLLEDQHFHVVHVTSTIQNWWVLVPMSQLKFKISKARDLKHTRQLFWEKSEPSHSAWISRDCPEGSTWIVSHVWSPYMLILCGCYKQPVPVLLEQCGAFFWLQSGVNKFVPSCFTFTLMNAHLSSPQKINSQVRKVHKSHTFEYLRLMDDPWLLKNDLNKNVLSWFGNVWYWHNTIIWYCDIYYDINNIKRMPRDSELGFFINFPTKTWMVHEGSEHPRDCRCSRPGSRVEFEYSAPPDARLVFHPTFWTSDSNMRRESTVIFNVEAGQRHLNRFQRQTGGTWEWLVGQLGISKCRNAH